MGHPINFLINQVSKNCLNSSLLADDIGKHETRDFSARLVAKLRSLTVKEPYIQSS